MNKKLIFPVLLVCVLALSLALAGCDTGGGGGTGGTGTGETDGTGGGSDPVAGTWTGSDGSGNSVKIVAAAAGKSWIFSQSNKDIAKGTYTYSGSTITAKITHVNTSVFNGANTMAPYTSLTAAQKKDTGSDTKIVTISGKSITVDTGAWGYITFTKQ